MLRYSLLVLALGGALYAGMGCGGDSGTRSFEVIGLNQARSEIRAGKLVIVEAISQERGPSRASPGAVLWPLPEGPGEARPPSEIPGGGVLVIAAAEPLGFRAAAALSRFGNRPVYLCIPRTAEERSSLYPAPLQTQEVTRGRDS